MKHGFMRFFALALSVLMVLTMAGFAEADYAGLEGLPYVDTSYFASFADQVIDYDMRVAYDEDGCTQITFSSELMGIPELFAQIGETELVVGMPDGEYLSVGYEEIAKFVALFGVVRALDFSYENAEKLYNYIAYGNFEDDLKVVEEVAAVEINRLAQLAMNEGLVAITETGALTIDANIDQTLDLAGKYLREYSKEKRSIYSLCDMEAFDLIDDLTDFDLMSYYDRIPGKLVSIAGELEKADLGDVDGKIYLNVTEDGNMNVSFEVREGEKTFSITSSMLNGVAVSAAEMRDELIDEVVTAKATLSEQSFEYVLSGNDPYTAFNLLLAYDAAASEVKYDYSFEDKYQKETSSLVWNESGFTMDGSMSTSYFEVVDSYVWNESGFTVDDSISSSYFEAVDAYKLVVADGQIDGWYKSENSISEPTTVTLTGGAVEGGYKLNLTSSTAYQSVFSDEVDALTNVYEAFYDEANQKLTVSAVENGKELYFLEIGAYKIVQRINGDDMYLQEICTLTEDEDVLVVDCKTEVFSTVNMASVSVGFGEDSEFVVHDNGKIGEITETMKISKVNPFEHEYDAKASAVLEDGSLQDILTMHSQYQAGQWQFNMNEEEMNVSLTGSGFENETEAYILVEGVINGEPVSAKIGGEFGETEQEGNNYKATVKLYLTLKYADQEISWEMPMATTSGIDFENHLVTSANERKVVQTMNGVSEVLAEFVQSTQQGYAVFEHVSGTAITARELINMLGF